MFESFRENKGRPMIIGHRGYVEPGQPREIENTLLAFDQAYLAGAEGVEFDIHLSSDDQLVCFHDFTLGSKKINKMTLNEIKGVKLPQKQSIPILDEIIDDFKDKLYFNIHIRGPEAVYPVMDSIERWSLKDRCVISSFDQAVVGVVSGAGKGFQAALLYIKPWGMIEKAKALKLKTVHPFYGKAPLFNPLARIFLNHHLSMALKYGFAVNTWTVNSEKDARKLTKKGVTGIITDDTPLLSNLFSSP